MITGIALHYLIKELKGILKMPIREIRRKKRTYKILLPDVTINIELSPEKQSLYTTRERKPEGEGFFSSYIYGRKIESIEQIGLDRVVLFNLGSLSIVAEFFGRHGDLLVLEGKRILFSLKGKSGEYNMEHSPQPLNILISPQKILKDAILTGKKIEGLSLGFVKYIKTLGDKRIDEFLKREYAPCYNQFTFSPFYISGFLRADSMNQAVLGFLKLKEKEEEKEKIKKHINEIERKIAALKKHLAEIEKPTDFEKFKYYGDLLMTYKNSTKRKNPVVLTGFSGEKVEIPIDTSKSIQENAKIYYKRYKKAKSKEEKKKLLAEKIKREIEKLEKMKKIIPEKKGKEETIEKPYREFTTAGGFTVLVGKNAKGNEIITFKIARPYDLFFHVREAPGSHVIMRLKEKGKPVPQEDIIEAARIAAWFSKAKHSKIVPVQYTEVRYIRKPRKGPQGKVILTREKVIFVEPLKYNVD